jgi:hypothetical protein
MRALLSTIGVCALGALAAAQSMELHVPSSIHAGESFSATITGTGQGMFYVIAPGHVSKRATQFGGDIQTGGTETRSAGNYLLLACAGSSCAEAHMFVDAAEPEKLAFLLHPSRVPVSQPNAINAVSVVLDRFRNIVMTPSTVTFRVSTKDGPGASLPLKTRNGITWTRLASGPKEGPIEIDALVGDGSEKRVVQQVASDPCNLHAGVQTLNGRLVLQTDPVRDCKGNALPDGTIVTFTKVDKGGRSTVDAPIKKSIARAEMPYSGAATISVASGVTLGNEIRVGDGR